MSSTTLEELGKLVLRLSLGTMVLLHGIGKLVNGIGFIEQTVVAKGLPAILAWGVYAGEVIAPVMLILGLYTRLGGLLIMVNMLFAIFLVHSSQIFELNNMWGWSLELQGMFLFGSLAVMLLGAGRYSTGGRNGPWN